MRRLRRRRPRPPRSRRPRMRRRRTRLLRLRRPLLTLPPDRIAAEAAMPKQIPLKSTLALPLLLACIGAAHGAPPAQLQPGQRPPPGSTEAELWYGMDQAEKQIRQSPY